MQNEVKTENRISAKVSGAAFSLSALMPIVITYLVVLALIIAKVYDNVKDGAVFGIAAYAFAQIGLIVAFFIVKGLDKTTTFKTLAGVEKFDARIIILLPFVAFGMIFGLGFLNGYFIELLKIIGLKVNGVTLKTTNAGELVFALVCVAVLPAVAEEVFFRSIILKGVTFKRVLPTVLFSGFCFALYHHNPAQTVYQFVVGVIFAYIAIASKSVLPTMILHFVNNAFVILFGYFAGEFAFNTTLTAIFTVSGICCLVGCFAAYRFWFKIKADEVAENPDLKTFFLFSGLGVILCVVQWILGCL